MSRSADYFATIDENGKIVLLTSATPSHTLTENQVMLTFPEYKLLLVVSSLEEAKSLLDSVAFKIQRRLDGKSS